MGIFNRKSSKISVDGSTGSGARNGGSASHTPLSAQTPNGASFSTPSLPSIDLPRPPDPNVDPAAYLRSIHAVRERTRIVSDKARRNQLKHFDVDMTKFAETAGYTVSIIKVRICACCSVPGD